MFRRKYFDILKSRLAEPRRFIQVIAGPRQIGKSTVVKQVVTETDIPYLFVTTEDAPQQSPSWLRSVWQQARQTMSFQQASEFWLIVDEVHKIDNWSEVVKGEWDKDTMTDLNLKVVLLGSSRLLLKDGLQESLAGRFEIIEMPHWSLSEMQEAFGWTTEQYIYFGGYPGGASLITDERRWRRYIKSSILEPAITKDVLLTKRIYKPALMQQLFELGCSYSGQLLSFNKIQGQLQDAGNTDTLATYLRVLNESCLLAGLQQYAEDDARKYKSIPKYQVYNSALLSANTDSSYQAVYTNPQLWGRWVETAVGAHLVNYAKDEEYKVYYWRQKNDEVDFILKRQNRLLALEVKSGNRMLNNGVFKFVEQFPNAQYVVIGGNGISIEQFLLSDVSRLFEIA